jgi:hypothetical protein
LNKIFTKNGEGSVLVFTLISAHVREADFQMHFFVSRCLCWRSPCRIELVVIALLVIPFLYLQLRGLNTPVGENPTWQPLVVVSYLVLGCLVTTLIECTLDFLDGCDASFWWNTLAQTLIAAAPILLGATGLVPLPPLYVRSMPFKSK